MKRLSIYIDGENYRYTFLELDWSIDLYKFRTYCEGYGEIVDARFYSPKTETQGQKKFFNVVRNVGFKLITKPIKTIINSKTGEMFRKANFDVEIAGDMVNDSDNFDAVILVSGDGDFLDTVRKLKAKGKEVIVISTKGRSAIELVNEDGVKYIDLEWIKDHIKREKAPRSMIKEKACAAEAVAEVPETPQSFTTDEVVSPIIKVEVRRCVSRTPRSDAFNRKKEIIRSKRFKRAMRSKSENRELTPDYGIA